MAVGTARRGRTTAGFSLIELLVALAIIATIVAILLPAIMAAREAARRAVCLSHLHQIGLAIRNYEGVHGTFPIGARAQLGFGPSWYVGLLPFVDQGPLYNAFDMDSANNGLPSYPLPLPLGSRNGVLLTGKRVPTFWCPSSSLTEMLSSGTKSFQAAAFVGISGAPQESSGPASRSMACCGINFNNGSLAANGSLFPGGSVRLADLTDGESNVMVVGEQSALLFDSSKRIDGGYPNGWSCGVNVVGVPPLFGPSATTSPYNLTTVRHPPNSSYLQDGVWDIRGPNNPLSSSHEGGVHILLGDGGTRMMNENIDTDLQWRLAVRDDKQPVGDF